MWHVFSQHVVHQRFYCKVQVLLCNGTVRNLNFWLHSFISSKQTTITTSQKRKDLHLIELSIKLAPNLDKIRTALALCLNRSIFLYGEKYFKDQWDQQTFV